MRFQYALDVVRGCRAGEKLAQIPMLRQLQADRFPAKEIRVSSAFPSSQCSCARKERCPFNCLLVSFEGKINRVGREKQRHAPLWVFGACSAAVWSGGRVVSHLYEEMERGQAERLAPMLQSVMDRAALAFSQLQIIGVTVGPGSFTGIRIGLSKIT